MTGLMTKKVMFVISGLEKGGAEYQLVAVASELSRRGWDVTVLSFLPLSPNSWANELSDTDVTLITLHADKGLGKYTSLVSAVRHIKRISPDVLVGFMFHGIMTARIAGRIGGVTANVSSIHSERDGAFRERIMALTDSLTDAVAVLSQDLASDLAHKRIASPSRMHIIPNSVDVPRFAMRIYGHPTRELLRIAHDQFLWLAVGRLDEAKDYPNLLHAFSELSNINPNARLIVAGDGPLKSDLESLMQHLGIEERVSLLGLRQDMPALYVASDAFVLSSAWEGMPNVVLEAMASSTPVVATSVGAVPEMIADGESGLIVPPRDPEALAEAMEHMMALSHIRRQAVGAAGYARVLSDFSRESVIDKWEDLFEQLLAGKS